MKQQNEIGKCSCGAITVEVNGREFSMKPATYRRHFDVKRVPQATHKMNACNYCVNHWGVELCACGSGKKYNKCKGGIRGVCGRPMQNIEDGTTHIRGGWMQ